MSQVQTQRVMRAIGVLQIAIIVLVVITALVHLQRGIGMSMGGGFPRGGAAGSPAGAPAGGFNGRGNGGFNIMQLIPVPLPTLFLLNGIGYLVLVTALYLPALRRYQPLVRWLLILFTAVTIIMYLLIVGFRTNPIGLVDKVVELALIALLFIDGRQSLSSTSAVVPA